MRDPSQMSWARSTAAGLDPGRRDLLQSHLGFGSCMIWRYGRAVASTSDRSLRAALPGALPQMVIQR